MWFYFGCLGGFCACVGGLFLFVRGFFLIGGWAFMLLLFVIFFFCFVLNKCFHLMQAVETQGAPTESQKCNCTLLTTRRHSWRCGAQSVESRAIPCVVSVTERECVQRHIYICHTWHGGCKGRLLVLASWLFGDCKAVGRAGY